MNWLLSGLAAALGVPVLALLAAPQQERIVHGPTTAAVRGPQRTPLAAGLRAAQTGPLRTALAPVSKTRKGQQTGAGGVQGTGPGPLAVVVNGQIIPATAMSGSASFTPLLASGTWHNLSIWVPQTQQEELFILGIPNIPATVDAPLLVGMRQSNVSHADIIAHTTFWDECLARGWYLLAPLSRGMTPYDTHGGSTLNAQENTRAALAWVIRHYSIDRDRMYGVGFSGGASLAASFASRHLDPASPMFAAMVFHTGSSDLVDTYYASNQAGKAAIEILLGGDPTTMLFEYRRIASLELDAAQIWLSGGDHCASNLGSIPTQIWYATNDSQTDLVQHTEQLFDWMNLNANGPIEVHTRVSLDAANSFHSWEILDETQICDWFALQTLTPPLSGDLLIDRDATYHDYAVQQDTAGAFSRLSFAKTLATNELALTQTDNVQTITVSPDDIGLFSISGVLLTLNLEAIDRGDVIVLEGIESAPIGVLRDGALSASWTYAAVQQTLTITELHTGVHVWTLQF